MARKESIHSRYEKYLKAGGQLTLVEWKRSPAVAMGRMKSEKKARAVRENGKKGGRPKKTEKPQ